MKRILYIEDDPEQLVMVRALLEHSLPGVVVDVCCTAAGAEGFLNRSCYDVVICDVALPGELGTDIAEKILERDPQQPIYLWSEYTGPNVKADADRIGLELQRKFSEKDPHVFVAEIRAMMIRRPCASLSIATNGEAAATREKGRDSPKSDESDVNHGRSAVESSRRPLKSIRLTSPYVLAARASLA
jgi:DNA-binding NarL/FixJ family response regulator